MVKLLAKRSNMRLNGMRSFISARNRSFCWNSPVDRIQHPTTSALVLEQG